MAVIIKIKGKIELSHQQIQNQLHSTGISILALKWHDQVAQVHSHLQHSVLLIMFVQGSLSDLDTRVWGEPQAPWEWLRCIPAEVSPRQLGMAPCHIASCGNFRSIQTHTFGSGILDQSKPPHSSSLSIKEEQINSVWFWSNKRLSPCFLKSIVSSWNNYCEIIHFN